jgi:hypothetical protein
MGGGGIAQMSDPRKGRKMFLDANCGTKKGRPGRSTGTPRKQTALGGLPRTVTDWEDYPGYCRPDSRSGTLRRPRDRPPRAGRLRESAFACPSGR